jgi:hypothetical protein
MTKLLRRGEVNGVQLDRLHALAVARSISPKIVHPR